MTLIPAVFISKTNYCTLNDLFSFYINVVSSLLPIVIYHSLKSQAVPVNPVTQEQRKEPKVMIQRPPFWQGFGKQAFETATKEI